MKTSESASSHHILFLAQLTAARKCVGPVVTWFCSLIGHKMWSNFDDVQVTSTDKYNVLDLITHSYDLKYSVCRWKK